MDEIATTRRKMRLKKIEWFSWDHTACITGIWNFLAHLCQDFNLLKYNAKLTSYTALSILLSLYVFLLAFSFGSLFDYFGSLWFCFTPLRPFFFMRFFSGAGRVTGFLQFRLKWSLCSFGLLSGKLLLHVTSPGSNCCSKFCI